MGIILNDDILLSSGSIPMQCPMCHTISTTDSRDYATPTMVNLFTAVLGFTGFFSSQTDNSAVVDTRLERLHYQVTSHVCSVTCVVSRVTCHVSHYQTTAGLLFLSTTLLGLTDIFGKQILCRGQEGDAETAIRGACSYTNAVTLVMLQFLGQLGFVFLSTLV